MRLPDLGRLVLHPVKPTGVDGVCGYDPTVANNQLQGYFTDMLLDSDRNARYAEAIFAAVSAFVAAEGRPPVVLDAGCGTGMLTLLALAAGAERVISVDVNRGHINKLAERLGPELAARCTPMHVGPPNPNPFVSATENDELKFDMLVSEILGSFANGECASYYLAQYAQHMNVHPSGNVYCVPRTTTQTFRKVSLPKEVMRHVSENYRRQYMGTDFVALAYEYLAPTYVGDAMVVREDRYSVRPFQAAVPRVELDAGYYVAEWEAELWPGTEPLRNTWEWAHGFNGDGHSAHARSNQWGLMFFRVRTTAVANYDANASVHSASVPVMTSVGLAFEYGASGLSLDEDGAGALRWLTPFTFKAATINEKVQDRFDEKFQKVAEGDGAGVEVLNRYINLRAVRAGLPAQVPDGPVFRMTIGAIAEELRARNQDQWMSTLDMIATLPFLVSAQMTSEFDVPIQFLPPQDANTDPHKRYRYISVGAAFRFVI